MTVSAGPHGDLPAVTQIRLLVRWVAIGAIVVLLALAYLLIGGPASA